MTLLRIVPSCFVVCPSGHKIRFNIESMLNKHWINIDNHLSMLIHCSVPTGVWALYILVGRMILYSIYSRHITWLYWRYTCYILYSSQNDFKRLLIKCARFSRNNCFKVSEYCFAQIHVMSIQGVWYYERSWDLIPNTAIFVNFKSRFHWKFAKEEWPNNVIYLL